MFLENCWNTKTCFFREGIGSDQINHMHFHPGRPCCWKPEARNSIPLDGAMNYGCSHVADFIESVTVGVFFYFCSSTVTSPGTCQNLTKLCIKNGWNNGFAWLRFLKLMPGKCYSRPSAELVANCKCRRGSGSIDGTCIELWSNSFERVRARDRDQPLQATNEAWHANTFEPIFFSPLES